MKVDVGDWVYTKDRLPDFLTPVYAAVRDIEGSREPWIACGIIYGLKKGCDNLWGLPILDFSKDYEVYAWMGEWWPEDTPRLPD